MFPRDRYPIAELIKEINDQEPISEGDEWGLEFSVCEHDESLDDFGLIWGDGTEFTKQIPVLLRQAIADLNLLDNLVQISCEQEYDSSEYGIQNFLFHVAYITQRSEDSLTIEYFGTAVNTQMEATFVRNNDRWLKKDV